MGRSLGCCLLVWLCSAFLPTVQGQAPAQPKRKAPASNQPRTDRLGDPLPRHARARLGSIRRVDLATGKDILPRTGHQGSVLQVACSADGKVIASAAGEDDPTVRVWETATGRELLSVRGSGRRPGTLALSRDGKRLATVDGGVRLWDVTTGRHLARLGGDNTIEALAFSPDGKTVAAGGEETWIWDATTRKQLHRFTGFGYPPLVFSPDGKFLAYNRSRTIPEKIQLWEIATSKAHSGLGDDLCGRFFAFSPDGKTVAVWGAGNRVFLYETATRKLRFSIPSDPQTRKEEPALAFSPDGKILAGGEGRSILLWDPFTGEELLRLDGHQGPVTSLAFAEQGRMLISGSRDSTILIWEVPPLRLPSRRPETPITALPSESALVRVESGEKGTLLAAVGHPEPAVRAAAFRKLSSFARKDKAILAILIGGLCEKDDEARMAVLQALWELGSAALSALPNLLELLKSSRSEDAITAAGILGEMGPDAQLAIPALSRALEDARGNVTFAILEALRRIDPE